MNFFHHILLILFSSALFCICGDLKWPHFLCCLSSYPSVWVGRDLLPPTELGGRLAASTRDLWKWVKRSGPTTSWGRARWQLAPDPCVGRPIAARGAGRTSGTALQSPTQTAEPQNKFSPSGHTDFPGPEGDHHVPLLSSSQLQGSHALWPPLLTWQVSTVVRPYVSLVTPLDLFWLAKFFLQLCSPDNWTVAIGFAIFSRSVFDLVYP